MSIDTATSTSALIISSNRQIEGLAFDPVRRFFTGLRTCLAIMSWSSLISTRGRSQTSAFSGGFTEITAMTFDETTDTIFAVDQTARRLLHINPLTRAATDIGSICFVRYKCTGSSTRHRAAICRHFSRSLFPGKSRLNKTGSTTLVGSTGSNVVTGLDFHPVSGRLFGWAQFRDPPRFELVSLDLTTGLATRMGGVERIVALEFVDLTVTVDIDS